MMEEKAKAHLSKDEHDMLNLIEEFQLPPPCEENTVTNMLKNIMPGLMPKPELIDLTKSPTADVSANTTPTIPPSTED